MTSTERSPAATTRAAVSLVLLWAIIGPQRNYLVAAAHDAIHSTASQDRGGWLAALVAASVVFIGLVGMLKLYLQKLDGAGSRYWGWWWAGAALTLTSRLLKGLLQLHGFPSPWLLFGILLPCSTAGMTLLLVSGLNADPMTIVSNSRRIERPRDWARVRSIVPLVIGVVVLLAAEALVFPFDVHEGAVKDDFFHEVLSLLPVLLLALAFEVKFFRGRGSADHERTRVPAQPDPVLRAAPIATGIMIAVAILLAGSTLIYDHSRGTEAWHVFVAFALSVQASATALFTVLWLAFSSD